MKSKIEQAERLRDDLTKVLKETDWDSILGPIHITEAVIETQATIILAIKRVNKVIRGLETGKRG